MTAAGTTSCLIINSRAGTALGLDPQDMMRRAHLAFEAAGAPADVQIAAPGEMDALLKAARSKERRIIVGGGDGTVRAAAQCLVGTQIPLGIIPLGTMNLFAREIGMPLDFDASLAEVANGVEMRVDVASVNGDVFLCNSLMGLPAIFSRERETLRGNGFLNGLRKAWGLARRISSLRHRIGVELDDGTGPHRMRVMAMAVSNNIYDGASGLGLRRPKLDGGDLGIYASRHRTGLSATAALIKAYVTTWRGDPFVSEQRAHIVRITSARRRIWLSNDGEAKAFRTPLIYRCHPAALSVIVPRGYLQADKRAWSTIALTGAGHAGSLLAAASNTL